MNKAMKKRKYVLVYTLLFAVFAAGAFFLFPLTGKSFVWNQDGGPQYVPYLAYMGSYLRDFVRRALTGDFTIKMFDFTIGYGDDVGSIIRAHPLDFLSVLVPMRYTEQLYTFLILLRIYLAGLSFSAYCMYISSRSKYIHLLREDILTGALLYAFCGYTLRFGIVHPTFESPYIFLPLLLLAAERMMRGEGYLLFSFTVFLGFMSNYYFMYMAAIGLLLYVLLRFPVLFPRDRVKHFFLLFLQMSGAFLLGTGMAMATLLPIVRMLGSSARIGTDTVTMNLLSYGPHRWRTVLVDLIAAAMDPGYSSHLSFAAPVIPAAVLLLCERTKERKGIRGIKAAVVIGYLMLIIPAAGYVMTGFSAVNNRWMFLFAFVISLTYVVEANHLRNLRGKEILLLFIGFAVYAALAAAECSGGSNDRLRFTAAVLLGICTAVFAVLSLPRIRNSLSRLRFPVAGALTTVLVFACVVVNAWYLYAPEEHNFISEFYESGTSVSRILDSKFAWINRIEDDGFYRVDTDQVVSNTENYSLLLGYRPTSQYNSIISGPLTYWMLETENTGIGAIHRLQSLDSRAAMETLAGVKYFFTRTNEGQQVPYGFDIIDSISDESYSVYQNRNALSIGYTYDTCLSREDYLQLNAVEKEAVMLQAAVVEDMPEGMADMSDAAEDISDSVFEEDGILTEKAALPEKGKKATKTEKGYYIKKNGGIDIAYNRRAGYTCYMRLSGLDISSGYAFLDMTTENLDTTLLIRGTGKLYSLNRTEYIVNLGYDELNSEDSVSIRVRKKGSYSLSGIEFIYVPMATYEAYAAALAEESLENVSVGINTVSGTADITGTKMMVFSIPWSKGWSLTVDGEKQDLLQTNTAWMGAVLTEGSHEIRLTYTTPGAAAGRIAAAAAWLVWLGLGIRGLRRHSSRLSKKKQ